MSSFFYCIILPVLYSLAYIVASIGTQDKKKDDITPEDEIAEDEYVNVEP
jgi:hypothetical protein